MTEESFQQCKKVMKKANQLRGLITQSKEQIENWTKLEEVYNNENKILKAAAARKNLVRSLKVLDEREQRFEEMVFPDSNIVVIKTGNIENI